MDNRYVNRAKISEAKFRQLVRYFALDLTATQMAELSNLNRNTVNRYLNGIRERVAEYCNVLRPVTLRGYTEVYAPDAAQTRLLGILEDGGTIYTVQFGNTEAGKIQRLLESGLPRDGVGASLPGIDMIVELGSRRRIRLCGEGAGKQEARTKINRIEGFIGYSQSRLEKFKGIHNSTYTLHLKECELRYNHKSEELYPLILKIIRNKPLF